MTFDPQWIDLITQSDLADLLATRPCKRRFEEALALLESKLSVMQTKDLAPQYVVVCLPFELHQSCRTADFRDKELGEVHRDLRRAFKAMVMKYRIPTQILREETAAGRDKEHYSKITWNFFTGLYFKAGGFPWGPVGEFSIVTCRESRR